MSRFAFRDEGNVVPFRKKTHLTAKLSQGNYGWSESASHYDPEEAMSQLSSKLQGRYSKGLYDKGKVEGLIREDYDKGHLKLYHNNQEVPSDWRK